jgi:cytochrome bd-type quinol oxidase subunit 1
VSNSPLIAESRPPSAPGRTLRFYVIYAWGVGGLAFMLGEALLRLLPVAWEPIASGTLTSAQWLVYAGWVAFNGYSEGYRGFQKAFSPRAAARAHHVARHGNLLQALLAPLFCMSLFHASRRGLTVAWSLLIGIVALVLVVKALPQPWRGIVDGGVVVGLAWGLLTLCTSALRTLVAGPREVDLQLPGAGSVRTPSAASLV